MLVLLCVRLQDFENEFAYRFVCQCLQFVTKSTRESFNGELVGWKPCTLCKEFLALTYQETAKLMLQSVSLIILSSISDSTKLCCSTRPLLHGDSAAVVLTVIPRVSHISMKSMLENSPPLSSKSWIYFGWWFLVFCWESLMMLRSEWSSLLSEVGCVPCMISGPWLPSPETWSPSVNQLLALEESSYTAFMLCSC